MAQLVHDTCLGQGEWAAQVPFAQEAYLARIEPAEAANVVDLLCKLSVPVHGECRRVVDCHCQVTSCFCQSLAAEPRSLAKRSWATRDAGPSGRTGDERG